MRVEEYTLRNESRTPRAGWIAFLFLVLTSAYGASAGAQESIPMLPPCRTIELDGDVEWCEPFNVKDTQLVLVCDARSFISVHEIKEGENTTKRSSSERLQLGAGVRCAGRTGNIVYLHNLTDIYAVQINRAPDSSTIRMSSLWRLPISLTQSANADPEFLLRVVAAKAFANGVLVLRSDGACVLLRGADGEAVRRWRFPPANIGEIHVNGVRAALWHKHEKGIAVAFLDPTGAQAEPQETALMTPPPTWSGMCDAGLALVSMHRFTLVRLDGTAWTEPLSDHLFVGASTVVLTPVTGRPGDEERISDDGAEHDCLFIPKISGDLWAYDLEARREIFDVRRTGSSEADKFLPRALHLSDDLLVLEQWRENIGVYRQESAEPLILLHRPGATVLGAHIYRGVFYALFAEKVDAREATGNADSTTKLRLCRQPLPAASQPARASCTSQPKEAASFAIDAEADCRALWFEDALLLIDKNRVCAYTLP